MNIQQHKFVTEFLRWGDKAIAYKNAYNAATANYQALESSANRLLRIPEIAQTIEEAQVRIREQAEKEIREQQKGELLTIQKKRELLYQVATGEMHVLQYYKGKECNTCTQYVTPTINHMLRAIHLDNKLAGHYPLYRYVTAKNEAASQKHVQPEPENTFPADLRETIKNHNNSQQSIDCLNP